MGGGALRRPRRPLGEAQPRRGRALQPGAPRPRPARRAVRAVRHRRATATGSTSSTTACACSASPTRTRRRSTSSPRAASPTPTTSATCSPRPFHFGCEADDPDDRARVRHRAATRSVPRFKALFASDIGHWDVPDIREVLPEAWELVEDGARHRGRLPRAHVRARGVALGRHQPVVLRRHLGRGCGARRTGAGERPGIASPP